MHLAIDIFRNFWHFTQEASGWLLLGFLFAGLLRAFVPSGILFKFLGKGSLKSIFTATLIGIPLPLCSCGVIPTGVGLYKQGASLASVLAFFISTPVTTVTAIFLCLGMLGLKFTILEVIACFIVAFLTGILALIFLKSAPLTLGKIQGVSHRFEVKKALSCQECRYEFKRRIKTTFRYGFIEMVDDLGIYILVGLLGAGIIASLFPSAFIERFLGAGFLPLVIMVLVGTPMYICSTASVPFVAALIAKGMHPSAGLVFLIAGPATNISTILAIGKSMGKSAAFLYVSSIVIFSVLIAYIFCILGWL